MGKLYLFTFYPGEPAYQKGKPNDKYVANNTANESLMKIKIISRLFCEWRTHRLPQVLAVTLCLFVSDVCLSQVGVLY